MRYIVSSSVYISGRIHIKGTAGDGQEICRIAGADFDQASAGRHIEGAAGGGRSEGLSRKYPDWRTRQ